MKNAAILIIFFIRCMYLHPTDGFNIINDMDNVINNMINDSLSHSCIFGPKSMSMVLYNSANLDGKNIGVEESCTYIDSSKPIFFMVHGFISYANTTNSYELALQLVKKKGYTVFSLDWSDAACKNGIPVVKLLEYPQAVINTRKIGELMSKYVESLIQKCNILIDNITFIGHSLGAHVCGFAAKHIMNSGIGKIPLIIGVDPAAPLFELNLCDQRLCKTDADHVIVCHTSILGIPYPLGEIDFKMNGGQNQPDCGFEPITCSHSKCLIYLTNTLDYDHCVYPGVTSSSSFLGPLFDSPSYPSYDTTDCILFNDEIFNIKSNDKLREGNYYAFVESKPPYCTQKSFECKSLIVNN